MATNDNPLSAFFRGFQGAQQQALNNQLTEQLRAIQLLNAQKQLAELNKTPEERLSEQLNAAVAQQALSRGALIPAPAGLVGQAIAEPQAIPFTAPELTAAQTQGNLNDLLAQVNAGKQPIQFATPLPGAPGFLESPAAAQETQNRLQQQELSQLRNKARVSQEIQKEFETPAEKAAREASIAESKLKTAKSTAILDQIQKSASSGGKVTQPVFDPTGANVIAYEYFDPIKGTTDLIDIKTPKDAETFKSALDQSNKFDDDPAVKNYSAAISSIRGIQNLASDPNATAADDTALIFAFMKSIDPRSTVREGEQATVQNSSGIPDRIRNIYNNAVRGNRLTPTQRLEIFGAAEKSVSGLKTGYDLARTRFIDKSRRANLDENIVVGPVLDHRAIMREFSTPRTVPNTPSAAPTANNTQDQQAIEWLKSNPNDPRAPAIRQKLGL